MKIRLLAFLALFLGAAPPISAQTAEDDPLSPLPPIDPNTHPPADWSGWRAVPKLLGVSQVHRVGSYEHSTDLRTVRQSNNSHATVFMELVSESSGNPNSSQLSWRVTTAHGSGGEFSTSEIDDQSGLGYSSHLSNQGSYTGPLSLRTDPSLYLRLNDGEWGFSTLGEPADSWNIQTTGRISDGDQVREINESYPGRSLESRWIKSTAPKEVVPITGRDLFSQTIGPGQVAGAPGTHTTRVTAFIQFWPDWNDVELLVEIENLNVIDEIPFSDWRPQGNIESPDLPGPSPLQIKATLRPKAKNPTPEQIHAMPEVRRFRFELSNTSREPGVCLNWPPFLDPDSGTVPTEDPEYDLRFVANIPDLTVLSPRKQKAGVKPFPMEDSELPGAWVQLNCYDFGAHADLRVFAELADGREIVGHLAAADGKRYLIKIPERPDGSLIAQKWRGDKKVTAIDEADDDDQPRGDGQKGDGFSTYEEYRGFRVNRAHVSPDPAVKDLFVRSRIGELAAPGCRLLEEQSAEDGRKGLKIWDQLLPSEMSESRIMNLYRSASSPRSSSEPQHGLVIDRSQANGRFRISYFEFPKGSVRRPKNATHIVIDSRSDELEKVVAHEIAHAIGVEHHGSSDLGPVQWDVQEVFAPDGSSRKHFTEQRMEADRKTGTLTNLGAAYPIRVFREGESQEINPDHPDWRFKTPFTLYVAVRGGQHAGGQPCVVRYDLAGAYVPGSQSSFDRVIPDESRKPIVPLEIDSTGRVFIPRLCRRCQGTGINPERFGHATLGDCLHQLCVRDSAPSKPKPVQQCPDTAP